METKLLFLARSNTNITRGKSQNKKKENHKTYWSGEEFAWEGAAHKIKRKKVSSWQGAIKKQEKLLEKKQQQKLTNILDWIPLTVTKAFPRI